MVPMKVMGPLGLIVAAVFMLLGVTQVIDMEAIIVPLTSGPLVNFIETFDFFMLLMAMFVVVVGVFGGVWAVFNRR